MDGRRWDDRGETLVELLVTIVILGIAGVAVLAGLQVGMKASDTHRKQTTGSAYARSYAEAISQYVGKATGNYVNCAPANTYTPATVGFDGQIPAGFTAFQSGALQVPPGGGPAGACSSDTGVQQIEVKVVSSDGRASESVVVVLRKPCGATMAVCP